MLATPLIERACVGCGAPARHKMGLYGCKALPCSCCGSPVDGARRPTVLGPLPGPGESVVIVAQIVCEECANRCRECRPLLDSGAVRIRGDGRKLGSKSQFTGRYDGRRSEGGLPDRITPQSSPENGGLSDDKTRGAMEFLSPPLSDDTGPPTASLACAECGARLRPERVGRLLYCSARCKKRAERKRAKVPAS